MNKERFERSREREANLAQEDAVQESCGRIQTEPFLKNEEQKKIRVSNPREKAETGGEERETREIGFRGRRRSDIYKRFNREVIYLFIILFIFNF